MRPHVHDERHGALVGCVLAGQPKHFDRLQVVLDSQRARAASVAGVRDQGQLAEAVEQQECLRAARRAADVVDVGCGSRHRVAVDDDVLQHLGSFGGQVAAQFRHPGDQAVFLKLAGVVHRRAQLGNSQRLLGCSQLAGGDGRCRRAGVRGKAGGLRHLVEGGRSRGQRNDHTLATLRNNHGRDAGRNRRLKPDFVPQLRTVGHAHPVIAIVGQRRLVDLVGLERNTCHLHGTLGRTVLHILIAGCLGQTHGQGAAQVLARPAALVGALDGARQAGQYRQVGGVEVVILGNVAELRHIGRIPARQPASCRPVALGGSQFAFVLRLLRLKCGLDALLYSRFLCGGCGVGFSLRLERGSNLRLHHLVNLLLVHLYTLRWGDCLCLLFFLGRLADLRCGCTLLFAFCIRPCVVCVHTLYVIRQGDPRLRIYCFHDGQRNRVLVCRLPSTHCVKDAQFRNRPVCDMAVRCDPVQVGDAAA